MNPFWLLATLLSIQTTTTVADWHRFHFSQMIRKSLEDMSAACGELDNCRNERARDSLERYNCNCDAFCDQMNTCCYDSNHTTRHTRASSLSVNGEVSRFKCTKVYGQKRQYVFMVDTCNSDRRRNKRIYENCRSSAEEKNDFYLAIPVTSRRTGITYKNQYCALCNNDANENDVVLWDVSLEGDYSFVVNLEKPNLHYNHSLGTWIAENDDGDEGLTQIEVSFSADIPTEVEDIVHYCHMEVISTCADDWPEMTDVEVKCNSYMALSVFTDRIYRNPHCAICNFEDVTDMECVLPSSRSKTESLRRFLIEKLF